MSIFSPVHRVLPLCYAALLLGQATGSVAVAAAAESTAMAPALLPDPDPPAPTPGGGTYKSPEQQFKNDICLKRGSFLKDAMFIHIFLSAVTNGRIIQPSPWHIISYFLMGRIPPGNIFATDSALDKIQPQIPRASLQLKVV
ncbi:unnamed protein product [Pleuronectes platessa]|uniref:Uncharacterized protein n=1 Tax=Pleuronectes platessa TaxID=8262 RepID=A0A9N7U5I0_PLEPL|nr:unnamed protein product [Pleuronectes platessa]